MKLIFIGDEKDPTEALACEAMGIIFPRGQAVSVPGDVFEVLAPNPAFKAVPGKAESEPEAETAPKRGRPKKSVDPTPEPEAEAVTEGIE
jgi:hypothetical protein